jgi:hypothetical protein
MQLWAISNRASVDFIDGYTKMPFMTDLFSFVTFDALSPEDRSTLLHEFTHELCLQGPFSLLCAYLNAVDVADRQYAAIEANIHSAIGNTQETESFDDLWFRTYINYSGHIRTFYSAFHVFSWVLEGLAMFVQLDLKLSETYVTASRHWSFMLALLATRLRGKKVDIMQSSEGARYTEEEFSKLLDVIESLFTEARNSQLKAGLQLYLFTNTDPSTDHYFTGYLLCKQLQYRLAQLDPRLADPEVFLVFITSYFFNDVRLLRFCEPPTETDALSRDEQVATAIMEHLVNSIRELVSVDNVKLKGIIDTLINPPDAANWYLGVPQDPSHLDFYRIDYAAAIRGEGLRNVDAVPHGEKLWDHLETYVKQIEEELIQLFPFAQSFIEGELARVDLSFLSTQIYRYLVALHNYFRFAQIKRQVVAFRRKDKTVEIFSWYPNYAIPTVEEGPSEDFEVLLSQIEEEHLSVLDLTGSDIALTNELGAIETDVVLELRERLSTDDGSLCWLTEYDMLDITAAQRIWTTVREGYHHVTAFVGDVYFPPVNKAALAQLFRFLDRDLYIGALSVRLPPYIVKESWYTPTPQIYRETMHQAWALLFPDTKVSRSTLDSFFTHKLNDIAQGPAADELFRQLLVDQQLTVPLANKAAIVPLVEKINLRWAKYVGRNLISVETENSDEIVLRLSV